MRWLLLAVLATVSASAADRWRLQYFFDHDDASLELVDLAFPAKDRGVAVGILTRKDTAKPVCLVTGDGGEHWATLEIKGEPHSMFFLNDQLGWLVTNEGLFRTEEAGRSWKKLTGPKGMLRVHFVTENRGFAVGLRKQAWHTDDGGKTWALIPAAGQAKGNPEQVVYGWVTFVSPTTGIIAGWNMPRETSSSLIEDPDTKGRLAPTLGLTLETHDGGASWSSQAVSMFGRITRVRSGGAEIGIALLEYSKVFPIPSEVSWLNFRTGKSGLLYKDPEMRVTDLGFAAKSTFLAGVEHGGRLAEVPVPRRVRVLSSEKWDRWEEMTVDYRAVARRVVLASAPGWPPIPA
ncbi:MAG: WD40/YVTN/BNR-like repeat-containing protein [Bryobacteraceae bacterium]